MFTTFTFQSIDKENRAKAVKIDLPSNTVISTGSKLVDFDGNTYTVHEIFVHTVTNHCTNRVLLIKD